jgi:hypothetical protein
MLGDELYMIHDAHIIRMNTITVQTNAQKYIKISLYTQRALRVSASHVKYKV